MGNPLYRVRASGMGGSGYARPPLPGEPHKLVKNADGKMIDAVVDEDTNRAVVVPGVTTVLKSFGDPPQLVQWKIDQVAAYAVANLDALYNRTMEQGWGFLRWYTKRVPDLSDPLRNAHVGVVNDLAELGTNAHDWTQAEVNGGMYPPIDSEEMAQMAESWKRWRFFNTIKPVMTEVTVYGDGYAGTFDGLWYVNGKLSLLDEKTSRTIGDTHKMQLAALRAADTIYVKDADGTWSTIPKPEPEEYGFIQIRPDDIDTKGNFVPAFVKYHTITTTELDMYYERFMCALRVMQIDKELRELARSATLNTDPEEDEK